MRRDDNGIYRDMTQEELAEYYDVISAAPPCAATPADNAILINHRDMKIICAKQYEVVNNADEDRRNAK